MSRGMQKNARRVHIKSFVTDALTVGHAKDGRISMTNNISIEDVSESWFYGTRL